MQPDLRWACKKFGRNLPFDCLLVNLPVVECLKTETKSFTSKISNLARKKTQAASLADFP